MSGNRPKIWLLAAVAAALLAGHFAWIASTWDGMGYMKDEGYYFSASRDNFGWYKTLAKETAKGLPLKAFTQPVVDRHWRNNHEHPPFCKTVQGFHHMVFYEWLDLFNYGNSHRMATWSWSALLVVFLFLLATEWMGVLYGVLTVVFLFTLPRVFFHTHLNTFDMPVVAVWFVTAYTFRKGMESHRWSWLTGVLLGVGIATKNNAYFLPVLFFIGYMYSDYRRAFFRSVRNLPRTLLDARKLPLAAGIALLAAPGAAALISKSAFNYTLFFSLLAANLWIAFHWLRPKPVVPKHIAPIVPAVFAAPLTFFFLWPWIWFDTWNRLGAYINRHVNPPAWETYYLHDIIVNPPPFPWHYPFVMSAYTIPVTALVLGLLGMWIALANGRFAEIKRRFWYKATGRTAPEAPPLIGRWKKEESGQVIDSKWDLFFLITNILIPVLIIANPKTPVYGGTKHYMTAMPYFAVAAVLAIFWAVRVLGDRFRLAAPVKGFLAAILCFVAIVPGLLGIVHTHPNCLSYYNELMGGSIAAPEVGMQRTFWAASTRGALDHLNRYAPKNARVFWNNTPWDSFRAYQKDGFLRADIKRAQNEDHADYAVMNHWKYYTDGHFEIRRIFGARYAEGYTDIHGMPLTEVYRNVKHLGPLGGETKSETAPAKP